MWSPHVGGVVPFSCPESGPQNGTGNWPTGARKRHSWFPVSGAGCLRFCASVGPFVARSLPAHARPSTSLVSRMKPQPATPQSHGVQRWPGERGGRLGTRHMTANSTVSVHCPPNVVPPGGPFLGVVFLATPLAARCGPSRALRGRVCRIH